MSKIQCSHPACRVIIDKQKQGVRCEKHQVRGSTPRKVLDHQRTPQGTVVYNTKRWKVLSKKKLDIQPFCEKCWKENRERVADVVDHIIEIQDDKSKAYTFSNLMSLCHSCHNTKTAAVAKGRRVDARNKKMGILSL